MTGEEPIAIVNGVLVKEGDDVEGVKVIKIDRASVKFKYKDKIFSETLKEGVKKSKVSEEDIKKDTTPEGGAGGIREFFKRIKLVTKKGAIPATEGYDKRYLKYGGESVTLDIYNPGSTNCPVVILIHGSAGIKGDRAIRYRGFATDLMNEGIVAINVHYFESKKVGWRKIMVDTISYAQRISNVDINRIGLVGYSSGGTIALKIASIDKRVVLLAIVAGYLPPGFTKKNAARLPKTLMISGSEDTAIHTLNKLSTWFRELDKPFQTKIDPGIGHDNIPMDVFNEDWKTVVRFFTSNF